MFVNKITASVSVGSSLNSTDAGVQGAIDTLIDQDLTYLPLDEFYSFVVTGEALVSTTLAAFPNVTRNGVALKGDDKNNLLLNSIHGYILKVIPTPGLTATGHVRINITEMGTLADGGASNHFLTSGDSLVVMTNKGWPARNNTSIVITEVDTLTNCKVAFAIFGASTATATGYGSGISDG
jgi:hypothetical protein